MSDSDEERKECLNCGASFDGLKRCGKCKKVYFCNATCQREVWKAHCKVCVAPEGAAAPPTPTPSGGESRNDGAPAAAAAGKQQQQQQQQPMTVEEREAEQKRVKQEELRRINQEVLPEVDRLMRAGEFEEAVEHLEDGVAFASGYDERELLDTLSCLLARAFLGQKKPKEALMGLNPALLQARREGGPSAIKPHSIAAEAYKMQGDVDKMRVELRALMEAAAESTEESEQGAALLLAGCLLHDVGDLHAAVPLLSSAADAGRKLNDFGMRAGARNRAGAALLRLRQPQQALEAWTDELKALEDGEKKEAEEAAKAAEASDEKEIMEGRVDKTAAGVKALEVSGGSVKGGDEGGEAGKSGKEGTTGTDTVAAAVAAAPSSTDDDDDDANKKKKQTNQSRPRPRPRPVGDTRGRRCSAHGNMFMAYLLLGPPGRSAAEQHLQHALSLARQLSPPEAHEARVWVQAGNAHRLASTDGGGEEAETAYKKALELAEKAGDDDLVAAAERGLAKDLDFAALLKG